MRALSGSFHYDFRPVATIQERILTNCMYILIFVVTAINCGEPSSVAAVETARDDTITGETSLNGG